MFIYVSLMILGITSIPIVLLGYLFGICLFKPGPMNFSVLQKLLGLFFGITVIWIDIQQVVSEVLRPLIGNLFSISGHYILSDEILTFFLLMLPILIQILISPWKSEYFLFFMEHSILGNIRNAQSEKGEYCFYDGKIIQIGVCYPRPARFGGI